MIPNVFFFFFFCTSEIFFSNPNLTKLKKSSCTKCGCIHKKLSPVTQAHNLKKMYLPFLTQIEISNVSFSLFSHFRDLFFNSYSDHNKDIFFAHLFFYPKKICLRTFFLQLKFSTFWPKSWFPMLFFHFSQTSDNGYSILILTNLKNASSSCSQKKINLL